MPRAPRPSDSPTSIIIGGPMYEAMVRLGLWDVPRRIAAFWGLTWVPLAVLASLGGAHTLVEFLRDLPAQARFLFAAPMLVVAERAIEPRIAEVTAYFIRSGLVTDADRPRYQAALAKLEAACDSVVAECFLVLAAYAVGYFWFRREAAGEIVGWVTVQGADGLKLSAAGWWYAFGSIPVYQFLVYRWVWRLLAWFGFLWRVSRLNLRLLPTHPDLAGGLGFLAIGQSSFAAIVFPVSALIAAIEGEKMLLGLESFLSIRFALAGIVVVLALFPLMPLFLFSPSLLRAKRLGQFDYGLLGQRYTHLFDERWIQQEKPQQELLGTGDIQSLADIQNAFGNLVRMRAAPVDRTTLLVLLVAAALPMLPLALTEFPIDEVFKRLMKILI